jgi:hypothetical protein
MRKISASERYDDFFYHSHSISTREASSSDQDQLASQLRRKETDKRREKEF